jgi:hypothetical protein
MWLLLLGLLEYVLLAHSALSYPLILSGLVNRLAFHISVKVLILILQYVLYLLDEMSLVNLILVPLLGIYQRDLFVFIDSGTLNFKMLILKIVFIVLYKAFTIICIRLNLSFSLSYGALLFYNILLLIWHQRNPFYPFFGW